MHVLPFLADQQKARDEDRLHRQNDPQEAKWIGIEDLDSDDEPRIQKHPGGEPREVGGNEMRLAGEARHGIRQPFDSARLSRHLFDDVLKLAQRFPARRK